VVPSPPIIPDSPNDEATSIAPSHHDDPVAMVLDGLQEGGFAEAPIISVIGVVFKTTPHHHPGVVLPLATTVRQSFDFEASTKGLLQQQSVTAIAVPPSVARIVG
jgi:hypothetical protein